MLSRVLVSGLVWYEVIASTTEQPQATLSPKTSSENKDYAFLHMTDLHISKNRPFSLENLREFCSSTFPALTAKKDILFLALTGDFTDGMGDYLSLSQFGQQEADWTAFRLALDGCVKVGVPIFKIRGNHDAFGVESFTHPTNMFFATIQEEFQKLFSNHPSLKTETTHLSSGSFALSHLPTKSRFIFLDGGRTVPSPHQYHGEFSEDQAEWLRKFINGPSNPQTARTYIFIHFPLGCLTPSSRARLLAAVGGSRSRVTFLSGHIHSLVGRRGVQAIASHESFDELQLSDFKWSATVRKVDVESGLFVDIPMWIPVSATLFLDPEMRTGDSRSLVGVVANTDQVVDTVSRCDTASVLRPEKVASGMNFFSLVDELSCVNVTVVDRQSGKRSSISVPVVDTRLWRGTPARAIFTHFFEALQLLLLFEYLLVVLVARSLFLRTGNVKIAMYLVLSPVIPLTVSENFASRPWVVSNGVAGLDLATQETFLDFETIWMGIIMLMYLLFSLAVKSNSGRLGKSLWTVVLGILTLVDMRMMFARGGFKSVALSPHSWFVLYMWWTLLSPRTTNKK